MVAPETPTQEVASLDTAAGLSSAAALETLRTRAWHLADRYAGQAQRLQEFQAQWRRRQSQVVKIVGPPNLQHQDHDDEGSNPPSSVIEAQQRPAKGRRYRADSLRQSPHGPMFQEPKQQPAGEALGDNTTLQPELVQGSSNDLSGNLSPNISTNTNGGNSHPSGIASRGGADEHDREVADKQDQEVQKQRVFTSMSSVSGKSDEEANASNKEGQTPLSRSYASTRSGKDLAKQKSAGVSFRENQHHEPTGATSSWRFQRRNSMHPGELESSIHKAFAESQQSLHQTHDPRPTERDIIRLARKYRIPFSEIRDQLTEFNMLDKEQTGTLSSEQFLKAVRSRLVERHQVAEVPDRVMEDVWRTTDTDRSGTVDFEEFVAWAQTMAFSEEMLISSPMDLRMRNLAQEYQVCITEVERLFREFDKFDVDQTGYIAKSEFQQLVKVLLCAHENYEIPQERLNRLWHEANAEDNGTVCFQSFLLWYRKFFLPIDSTNQGEDFCPAAAVYRKLGTDRLASWYFRNSPQLGHPKALGDSTPRHARSPSNLHATMGVHGNSHSETLLCP